MAGSPSSLVGRRRSLLSSRYAKTLLRVSDVVPSSARSADPGLPVPGVAKGKYRASPGRRMTAGKTGRVRRRAVASTRWSGSFGGSTSSLSRAACWEEHARSGVGLLWAGHALAPMVKRRCHGGAKVRDFDDLVATRTVVIQFPGRREYWLTDRTLTASAPHRARAVSVSVRVKALVPTSWRGKSPDV
jgi:hypothetical protein